MRRAVAFGALPVALLVALAGCGSDGTSMRTPPPGASAPPLATTTAPAAAGTKATAALLLTSPSFESGGPIPLEYTCDGANIAPPLTWGSVPDGTVELAVTVVDADASGFVHWVLAGVDPTAQAIAVNVVPDGAVEAKSDGGTVGWSGPCPPKGSGAHHYQFTLYALTKKSNVTQGMSGRDAVAAIAAIPAVGATLIGTYQRA